MSVEGTFTERSMRRKHVEDMVRSVKESLQVFDGVCFLEEKWLQQGAEFACTVSFKYQGTVEEIEAFLNEKRQALEVGYEEFKIRNC